LSLCLGKNQFLYGNVSPTFNPPGPFGVSINKVLSSIVPFAYSNDKSIIVRINDRGPFVSGRIIDCSYAAGKAIGLDKSGIAPVKLTVLGFAGKVYHAPKPAATQTSTAPAAPLPRVHLTNFAVQVGAFRRHEGAVIYRDRYQAMDASKQVIIKQFTVEGAPLYRVWVTGFGSADEAKDFVGSHGIQGGFLIRP